MNTGKPSQTRIRVTPLRRLRGDTYVPRPKTPPSRRPPVVPVQETPDGDVLRIQ
ncbi:hypothetical protein [Streptomyces cylindrosporus]|uniref:Uncharacterized protein n=1 Tax=Streptomyces cylindrosporus TaxID=2927583 RepID=A0ABS9YDS4_9ACTN|nr:hypothetical protein [Streptomyces cylindrosporus]MCI3275377.1 hypothetical protein [Streptomyces cylindrosporus]